MAETTMEMGYEAEVFSEAEAEQLAAELLSVASEGELEDFLGNLFKRIGRGLAKVGKAVLPALKSVAKVALPIAGKAAGAFLGGPVGGAIGGQAGSIVSQLIKEAETSGSGDQEFEVAKRYVQFAGRVARNLSQTPPGQDAYMAARTAMKRAMPGAVSQMVLPAPGPQGPATGRWMQQGKNIVLVGVVS